MAVGDITPEQLGKLLDEVFGDLPAKAELTPVSKTDPVTGGRQTVVDMDVPQSVAVFGMGAMPRKDPDFMAAFVLNQILGGGGFASKLMEEVREKRGLAYSVYTYVYPYQHASIFSGGVATRNDMMGQSLDIIRAELKKMARRRREAGRPRQRQELPDRLLSAALRHQRQDRLAASRACAWMASGRSTSTTATP